MLQASWWCEYEVVVVATAKSVGIGSNPLFGAATLLKTRRTKELARQEALLRGRSINLDKKENV
jgi:hypothetical protein